jgi:peptidoglycan/xylan/chitin deacetylase (PgdA/CDA1 family)
MFYFVKTPWILKKIYPRSIWNIPTNEKILYLSFDDGPHPTATPFVLEELQKYKAKATFFCIGKNVKEQPQLYRKILEGGHRVGNHTHNHLNGWKTPDKEYFRNIIQASEYIDSDLFRPPYGKISSFQIAHLQSEALNFRIIMWDVLSGDFDKKVSGNKCISNVIGNAANGSIVIFHDSEKAFNNLKMALPKVLSHFSKEGFKFNGIK